MPVTNVTAATDDPRTDGFDLVARNFERGSAEARSKPERYFRIGERSLRLRFAGDALVTPLTRAITDLEVDSVDEPDLTVSLRSGTRRTSSANLTSNRGSRIPTAPATRSCSCS